MCPVGRREREDAERWIRPVLCGRALATAEPSSGEDQEEDREAGSSSTHSAAL